ncbi:prolyl 4-hydroxylase subunit alpha-1-like isoform X2 [Parasteatoda tepidariorum]|uniref:prolyl 4-hydroxylase subunit alpha-1-like isoform X2 n=1 Tax=Parasteatoda tepidariorum TaxID=114398 RepID=UPI001C728F91|nr:prolyl 4-hydroxylase subunit alpha-1-like [Parasteatoda tepidariorum]XP_042903804.1 prolyl 4-hydroxylase subunit alpha-1-like [Parasteatoda tepidariorum]
MKCHFPQLITIILSCCFHVGLSEFYTAIAELEKLLETEAKVVNSLNTYLRIEEERLQKVKWLSQQYADLYNAANKDVETFLSNPVNAYLLVKRLSADWETTNQIVESLESREVIQNITNEVIAFPNKEDLSGAAAALIRLQEIYLLDAATLAGGQIKGTIPSSNLTAGDCFELGKHAYSQGNWNRSILWMEESLLRLELEEDLQPLKTADKADIYEYMAFSHFSLDNVNAAAEFTEKLIQVEPEHPRAMGNLLFYQIRAAEYEMNKNEKGDTGHNIPVEFANNVGLDPAITKAYEQLCRGESLKTLEEESELYCYYTTNNNSYLLLQPVKVEILNFKPKIAVYYDVLKDRESNVLKEIALPQLARATVNNGTSGQVEFASYRISKSTWLQDYQSMDIPKINQRIEDITGLDTEFAEALHVINYGIGGHYEPHFDFAHPDEVVSFIPELGNRLATWIFYLSDVPAGGSTVFPTLGVEVKPVKGSAAFWYNVYKDGSVDENTRHAACPVLAGSKWVANKWIHEFGNEFNRPCGLSPYM